MSYWVTLGDPPAEVESFEEGGTYVLGGSEEAALNVTYNYSEVYRLAEFSLRDLDGKKASETIDLLERLVEAFGTKKYEDYWAPTPGNAGRTLNVLLGWARQYPDKTWRVN